MTNHNHSNRITRRSLLQFGTAFAATGALIPSAAADRNNRSGGDIIKNSLTIRKTPVVSNSSESS